MIKGCAYCGGPPPFTREHVWPGGICERVKSYSLRYSSKANKVFSADLTIRDVCARCNNEALSELDDYFCGLYDRSFANLVRTDQFIEFQYDFDLLARSLLKISFNAARVSGIDADCFARYAPVIGAPHSSPTGLLIKLTTIAPTVVYDKNGNYVKEIPPLGVRCGAIGVVGRSRAGLAVKIVQINSYRFYIAILENISDIARGLSYLSDVGGTRVTFKGIINVPSPCLNTVEAFEGVEKWPVNAHRKRVDP